jgi:hypothetical protein
MLVPVICFIFGYPEHPDWQSGEIAAYAQMFLSHTGSMAFYPLLFYNVVSMGLLIYHADRFVQNAFVRFGIYSGVVVALGFFGLFSATAPRGAVSFIFWACVCTILPGILFYYSAKNTKVAALAIGLICLFFVIFPIAIFASLMFSTPWAVASYATMSYLIIRHRKEKGLQFSLAQLLGTVTWFGGYCAAWRVAYLMVLEEYSKLPTAAPQGCYLCTAAARGHRRFVRSEDFISADGRICRVNDQLRRFKAFELFLIAVFPSLHRLCRSIYDCIGPVLARTIACSLFADFAYVALKPFEWICRGVLLAVVKDREMCFHLYSNFQQSKGKNTA